MGDSVRFQGGYKSPLNCELGGKDCGITNDKPGSLYYAVDYLNYHGNLISSDFSKLETGQNNLKTKIQTYGLQNIGLENNPFSDYKSDYDYSNPNNALSKTTTDGITEDLDVMLLRQNNFYIFGTLTLGTILIIAITIGSI
jgi:hypothetical protein